MSMNIRRQLVRRLVLAALAMSVLLGCVALVIELEKVDEQIVAAAIAESKVFVERHRGELFSADGDAETLRRHLELFLRERTRTADGHFVEAEIYDAATVKIAEAAVEESSWLNRPVKPPHVFSPEPWYQRQLVGLAVFIQVVVPLPNSSGLGAAYFEGVYQVDNERLRDVAGAVLVTVLQIIFAVIATTAALYPVIRQMNRRLEEHARGLEEALREARDADAATRAKSVFLATMSHEIRTPLNGIIGALDLIDEAGLPAEQRKLLAISRDSSALLMTIIGDILDFSKIEAGKLELEAVAFSPCELAQGLARNFGQLAAAKGLAFDLEIDPQTPLAVIGDPVRLRQVLFNLIGNAIKFTARGRVCLTLAVTRDTPELARLRFTVTDSGIGLGPDQRKRLFLPFVQADGSTTRQYGGTGLGLSISQRLVGLMGGRITVESEPGKGSRFAFEVPCAVTEPVVSAEPAERSAAGPAGHGGPPMTREEAQARGRLVLLAEDNVANQQVIGMQIARLGFLADVVTNGKAAVDAARRRHYALILMDIHMPEMDGPDAARAIRSGPGAAAAATPIIALTASATAEEIQRCRQAGMDDVATKPISLRALGSLVERWASTGASRGSDTCIAGAGVADAGMTNTGMTNTGMAHTGAACGAASAARVLDLQHVRETLGNLDRWVIEALRTFPAELRCRLVETQAAIEMRNAGKGCTALHATLGAARTAGAMELADLLARLEQNVAAGKWSDADELAARLEPAVDRVIAAIGRL